MGSRTQHYQLRKRAFTLIEALATLVLVGVVLPVAMRGVTISMQASANAKHTAEATELARHKLTELSLSTDAGSLTGSGDFAPDFPDYRWTCASIQRDYGVTEYTVEVTWTAQGTDRSLSLSSLFFPVATAAAANAPATPNSGGP